MKKTLLISVGVVCVLLITGVWVYIFLFAPPDQTSDTFSDLDVNRDGGPNITDKADDSDVVDILSASGALRQLTTRNVAGAGFTDGGIRFAEAGTGYIFEISLTTGAETVVSSETYPRTTTVVFSPAGNRIALTQEIDGAYVTTVGTVTKNDEGDSIISGDVLPQNASNIAFSDSGDEVFYFMRGEDGGIGRAYSPITNITRTVFTIPLREVTVLWGTPTYVYTKPSEQHTGQLYSALETGLGYTFEGGSGLMAIPHPSGILISTTIDKQVRSHIRKETGEFELPLPIFPEKCSTQTRGEIIYCAAPVAHDRTHSYPDDWYKGTLSFTDALWSINVTEASGALLSDFLGETGRQIDVSKLDLNKTGQYLYFIDKNTDSLWLYDLSL